MINSAIEKAAQMIGSKSKLACRLGVRPPTVQQWLNGDRPVPIDRAVQIEAATNGGVTRKDLRPNDWAQIWPELADKAA